MSSGIFRLGGKAVQQQYLRSKATSRQPLRPKAAPARRRRTGPF